MSDRIKPTGGFPPIIKFTKVEITNLKNNTNREFKSNVSAITIKDIMATRIKSTPFI